jgi:filamentous hemagglutinin family protein
MNANCYKTVFSKRLGALVAVGEHTSSQSKGQGAGGSLGQSVVKLFLGALASGFLWVSLAWAQPVALVKPAANTLPTGAQVTQGTASLSQAGSSLSINQSTAKAVINWQSFDIGSAAKVNVVQPNSQSVLLNRVLSDNPTQIFGQLNANGQVVLVNPRGIVVGSDGSVNTAGFTASALNISDADFMQGRYHYVGDGSNGEVLNQGTIRTAPGGYVALLGASVSNEGQIIAPQGSVALGAADRISVPLGSTGKIKLELSPASINASVANRKGGVIVAEGGQVYLQASAVAGALASVQQSGDIDTTGAQGGAVHLLADGGQIKVDGSITANSSNANNKGGDIVIGRDLETGVLADVADVSGAQLESKGGFVETSGKYLATTGTRVKAKDWLLDPYNITITDSASVTTYNPGTGGTYSFTPGATSNIKASDIAASLNDGTSVTITTGLTDSFGSDVGNLTVNSAIVKSGINNASLTLIANNTLTVNARIGKASNDMSNPTGKLNVNLLAEGASGAGIAVNNGIDANGGDVDITGFAGASGGHAVLFNNAVLVYFEN